MADHPLPWIADNNQTYNRNPAGHNQYGGRIVESENVDQFRAILVEMLREGLSRSQMLRDLAQQHQLKMGRRTLFKWLARLDLGTPRKPIHTAEEMGGAIVELVEEDIVNVWGQERIRQKLRRLKGIHDAPSDFVRSFLSQLDVANAVARAPGHHRKLHRTSLWSLGPGEEWSGDGHDKLARMGMPIWGLRDKATRRILGLWVVPNSRIQEVPRALFLLAARQAGGVPLKLVLDQGSEGALAGRVQVECRRQYAPDLDLVALPAFSQIKSVYNITIERSWRQLLEYVLRSILVAWDAGVSTGIYHEDVPLEYSVARWLWARVIQSKLDEYIQERNSARIRHQRRSHLPTGHSPNEFWFHPEEYDMTHCLIPIPAQHFDQLLMQYTPHGLFQFVADGIEAMLCEIYDSMGHPALNLLTTWDVYQGMLASAQERPNN